MNNGTDLIVGTQLTPYSARVRYKLLFTQFLSLSPSFRVHRFHKKPKNGNGLV